MIYLASPYTNLDTKIRDKRYEAAMRIVADYTKIGFLVYSPVAYYHPIALRYNLPPNFDFWRNLCIEALSHCQEIWLLPLPGWEHSLGVKEELAYAKKHNIPLTILTPDSQRLGF